MRRAYKSVKRGLQRGGVWKTITESMTPEEREVVQTAEDELAQREGRPPETV